MGTNSIPGQLTLLKCPREKSLFIWSSKRFIIFFVRFSLLSLTKLILGRTSAQDQILKGGREDLCDLKQKQPVVGHRSVQIQRYILIFQGKGRGCTYESHMKDQGRQGSMQPRQRLRFCLRPRQTKHRTLGVILPCISFYENISICRNTYTYMFEGWAEFTQAAKNRRQIQSTLGRALKTRSRASSQFCDLGVSGCDFGTFGVGGNGTGSGGRCGFISGSISGWSKWCIYLLVLQGLLVPCSTLMQIPGTTHEHQGTQNMLVFQFSPGFCHVLCPSWSHPIVCRVFYGFYAPLCAPSLTHA